MAFAADPDRPVRVLASRFRSRPRANLFRQWLRNPKDEPEQCVVPPMSGGRDRRGFYRGRGRPVFRAGAKRVLALRLWRPADVPVLGPSPSRKATHSPSPPTTLQKADSDPVTGGLPPALGDPSAYR